MNRFFEHSAGGLVIKTSAVDPLFKKKSGSFKILMVQVKNLQGQVVWTFPKGHLEKKETPEQAAIREVKEETGWECGISGLKPFQKVYYRFKRGDKSVHKKVTWFLMKPLLKTGEKDPDEILRVRWVSFQEAKKKISYESDKKLLKKLCQ